MSTFYLLPPRPLLGRRFGEFLTSVFPGLTWNSTVWPDLAEALGAAAQCNPDVFVVYREDLPDGEDSAQVLSQAFGAEPGDEVIEIHPANGPNALTSQRWQMN